MLNCSKALKSLKPQILLKAILSSLWHLNPLHFTQVKEEITP